MKQKFIDKSADHQRFSLRKLTIGVASVLLGTMFMVYSGNNVDAATEDANDSVKTEQVQDSAKAQPAETATVSANQNTTVANNKQLTKTAELDPQVPQGPGKPLDEASIQTLYHVLDIPTTDISDAQLQALGLKRDEFLDNGVKYHIDAKAYYIDGSTQVKDKPLVKYYLGQYKIHNKNGNYVNIDISDTDALNRDDELLKHGFTFSRIYQITTLIPVVEGGTIYVLKDTPLNTIDAQRAFKSEDWAGAKSYEWDTKNSEYVVDTSKAGLQKGMIDLLWDNKKSSSAGLNVYVVDLKGKTIYKNINDPVPSATDSVTGVPENSTDIHWTTTPDMSKAGVTSGIVEVTLPDGSKGQTEVQVHVVDLKGKTIYKNVNDPVPSATDSVTGIPENSTDIHWTTTPDMSKVGDTTGVVEVTFPDGSKGQAKVTVHVVDPKGQPTEIHINQPVPEPTTSLVPGSYPDGSKVEWITAPDPTKEGNQPVVIQVTYPDGTKSHEINTTVNVIGAKGHDITVNPGDTPDPKTVITNIPDIPGNPTFTWKEVPDTSKPGTKVPGTVVVTWKDPDGHTTTQEVHTTITVNTDKSGDKVVETKEVKRTIHFVDSNKNEIADSEVQNVKFEHHKVTDKSGKVVKDYWAPESSTMPAVAAKDIDGYTVAPQSKMGAAAVAVTRDGFVNNASQADVYLYYDKTTPEPLPQPTPDPEPEPNPIPQPKPQPEPTPDTDEDVPAPHGEDVPTKPEETVKPHATAKVAAAKEETVKPHAAKLPQTGSKQNAGFLAAFGAAVIAVAGMFGLAAGKKRH